MKYTYFFYLILISFLLTACQSEEEKQLEKIQLKLEHVKLEEIMAKAGKDSQSKDPLQVYHTYFKNHKNFFASLYQIPIDSLSDELLAAELSRFCSDKHVLKLIDTVQMAFPNNLVIDKLTPLFKRVKLHFPQYQTPKIYTFVTGFPPNPNTEGGEILDNNQVVLGNQMLGISLELFLGDSANYPMLMHKYMMPRVQKEYIPVAVAHKIVEQIQKPLNPASMPNYLQRMLHQGIRQYVVKRLCPNVPDTVVFRYSNEKLEWVKMFEKNIYNEQVQFLYKQDPKLIQKYLLDRPFTADMSQESPGRLGEYLGYKIAENYMLKHPESSLSALLQTEDFDKLFRDAEYKP